ISVLFSSAFDVRRWVLGVGCLLPKESRSRARARARTRARGGRTGCSDFWSPTFLALRSFTRRRLTSDTFWPMSLERFHEAQAGRGAGYDTALAEIRAGGKRSHWIWYIFPQIEGLGRSSTARAYAMHDLGAACAY